MATTFERYKQADAVFWGGVAIISVVLALASAAISAVVPPGLVAGLHGSRLDGGTLNAMRANLANLSAQTDRLRSDLGRVTTQMTLAQQDRTSVTKRVGALEKTLPVLIEQMPQDPGVDLAAVTASTGVKKGVVRPAEGGSVMTTEQPLIAEPAAAGTQPEVPPLPQAAAQASQKIASAAPARPKNLTKIHSDGYGVALGSEVALKEAYLNWTDIRNKVGALLIGLSPLIAEGEDGDYHLIAGPLTDVSQAEQLCGHLTRVGIQCLPMPYSGYALPQ